jgi:hypothetical protein
MLGVFAEFERAIVQERVRAGLGGPGVRESGWVPRVRRAHQEGSGDTGKARRARNYQTVRRRSGHGAADQPPFEGAQAPYLSAIQVLACGWERPLRYRGAPVTAPAPLACAPLSAWRHRARPSRPGPPPLIWERARQTGFAAPAKVRFQQTILSAKSRQHREQADAAELQLRIMQLAREALRRPLRLPQAKLSRNSNQIVRGRIRRFESYMPSQPVRSPSPHI